MLDKLKGKLIISCQALENEPLHSSFIMGRMALAAKQAGAVAIRAQGVEDINEIKKVTGLPVIGIIKKNYADSEIYITPTQKEIDELLETSCEMIALDATNRQRPNHESLQGLVDYIHSHNRLVMADCSTYDEAVNAKKVGCDCVSTTLCGYTSYSVKLDGPNLLLISALAKELNIPVIAEGKINIPDDLRDVFDAGAYCAVVGGAITRPLEIAKKFISVLKEDSNV